MVEAAGARRRGRAREEDDEKVDASEVRWLVSYSDYMMQLVVLFILLFSVSSVSEKKLKAISDEARKFLNLPIKARYPAVDERMPNRDARLPVLGKSLEELLRDLQKAYGSENQVPVDAIPLYEGVKITVRDAVFEEGSAEVPAAMKPILLEVSKGLRAHPSTRVELRGHVSVSPRDTENGDASLLSYRRATQVARELLGSDREPEIDAARLRIVACSFHEPVASAVPGSPEGNPADRRVEIVVTEERVKPR